MVKKRKSDYKPLVISIPGETLRELLEERGMTQKDLSNRMGKHQKTVNEIIKGKSAITAETALELQRVLGVSAQFWNNRQRIYNEYIAQKKSNELLQNNINWLKEIPYNAMAKLGWIKKHSHKLDILNEVLHFYGVNSPKE